MADSHLRYSISARVRQPFAAFDLRKGATQKAKAYVIER
jgi:hypothetical protein